MNNYHIYSNVSVQITYSRCMYVMLIISKIFL